MIVGLDPGITTAIAIMDTKGNVLNVHSKRDMNRAEVIRHILRFGKPVIISTDVSVTPKAIGNIATKLECVVSSPDISLGVNEKRELTRNYNTSLENTHEIDALAAAIKSWKSYRNLFSRIEDVLKEFDEKEIFPQVLAKILREGSPNIEDAVREIVESKGTIVNEKSSNDDSRQKDLIKKLHVKLTEKQQEIESLKSQNTLLSKALNEAKKLVKDGGSKEPTKDYNELEKAIAYLKTLRNVENRGYFPVIELENLNGSALEQINEKINLSDRVIFMKEPSDIRMLNNWNIKCLVTFSEIKESELANIDFPAIKIEENAIENLDDIKAIKTDYIENAISNAKKSGLIGWLKGYRKRKGSHAD